MCVCAEDISGGCERVASGVLLEEIAIACWKGKSSVNLLVVQGGDGSSAGKTRDGREQERPQGWRHGRTE